MDYQYRLRNSRNLLSELNMGLLNDLNVFGIITMTVIVTDPDTNFSE